MCGSRLMHSWTKEIGIEREHWKGDNNASCYTLLHVKTQDCMIRCKTVC